MQTCRLATILFLCASAAAIQVTAEPAAEHPSKAFTDALKAEFERGAYEPKYPEESRWIDGGSRYTILEPSAAKPDATDLVAYDTASGKRSILLSAQQFTPAGAKAPLNIDDYAWSPNNQRVLIFTNAQKVWRLRTRGDYWVLRLSDGQLTQIGKSLPATSLMFAKFSPDSQSVAYVSQNNIYVESLATGAITQLTHDGSYDIINGTTDWVTEEEFGLRDAFRWSPDSKSIAYWQFDQSGVAEYTLINDTKSNYPQTFHYKYPQPGGTNASVRVGVIPAIGGTATWIKLPGDPRNNYIPRMEWVPNSTQLVLQHLNRLQNDNHVYLVNSTTGESRPFFEDKDQAWVEILGKFEWVPNRPGRPGDLSLLWLSERDGWSHAYLVNPNTGQIRLITNFPADVIEEVALDSASGYFYFLASPGNPIQRYLYRSRLDGTGAPERITPASQPGTHSYFASPSGQYAMHSYASASHPPAFDLVELATGSLLRTVIDNQNLVAKDAAVDPNPVEFLETTVNGANPGEKVQLSTFLVKPPDFDPSKKYPLLVNVYSEPAATTVHDTWSYTFEKVIAREGYLVVSFDNQGTPAPKGRAWRKSIYGNIGVLASQQQDEAIVEFARTHPYVDTNRIGMWGHSGGGSATLNELFRHPGRLAAGVSIAPMADQLLYDTIYQERYMGLPSQNAKGYRDGSPISFADGLADPLLILHGSGDDNVHFQATERLVNKLIELGKPFDFMDYPNRTHDIAEGPGTLQHRFTLMLRFFEQNIPPGAR